MAEPKKRLTSTRSGARRSHLRSKKINLSVCSKCQSPILPHHVCKTCGYYRGNDVLNLAEKTRVKEERRKAREKEESEKK